MANRPKSLTVFLMISAGAAVCLFTSAVRAEPLVNEFSSLPAAETFIPASYQSRDVFCSRHAPEPDNQLIGLTAEDAAALIVLFLPWSEVAPVPPPPGGGDGNNGGTGTNTGNTGSSGSGNNGGNGGNGNGPGDPGTDPSGGSGNTLHPTPEPASMLSGVLGAGVIALFGWRRRRTVNQ